MKILLVEDEPIALDRLIEIVGKVVTDADIAAFTTGQAALEHVRRHSIDIAFLDIELGPMNGIALAKQIKAKQPLCNIIFCTGYNEYMADAFYLGASDYLFKPVTEKRMEHALLNLRHPPQFQIPDDALYVRCFGSFEIFRNGKPVSSLTKRAKELFAYLVDQCGAMCSTKEILEQVFSDRADVNLRVGRTELENALEEIGKADVLVRSWGKMGIDPAKLLCDYYEYQKGNPEAVKLYRGSYMEGYEWAAATRKKLKE